MNSYWHGTFEAAELCGVSVRQLQWWDEQGIACPSKPGGHRRYGLDDLFIVRLIVALRTRGIVPVRIRAIFSGGVIRKATAYRRRGFFLITDGRRPGVIVTSDAEVINIMRKAKCGLFVVHMPAEE